MQTTEATVRLVETAAVDDGPATPEASDVNVMLDDYGDAATLRDTLEDVIGDLGFGARKRAAVRRALERDVDDSTVRTIREAAQRFGDDAHAYFSVRFSA